MVIHECISIAPVAIVASSMTFVRRSVQVSTEWGFAGCNADLTINNIRIWTFRHRLICGALPLAFTTTVHGRAPALRELT